jgi:polygalacturonase
MLAATSVSDPTKSASAQVVVVPAPNNSITSVAVSPTTLSLNVSAQNQFTATVTGTGSYSTAVTWSAQRGSITGTGLYTAPSTNGSDVVTAKSVQDGTKSATASITVGASSVPSGTSVKSAPYNAYGDGVHDDTAAINACVSAMAGTGGTVVVPAGTYMVNTQANSARGILLGSNMTFYISAGATLQAITTSSSNTQGNVLTAVGVSNLTISGPGTVKGDKATHTGPQNEAFMGLYIMGTNVTVSGPTFSYHFSDGIYIGGGSSSNITISGVTCDNNTRQGLSITKVDTMLVTGCTFSNTRGTDPAAGIDIEPNSGSTCSNVHITGCTFFNNAGGGLEMGPSYSDRSNTFVTGCIIENNEFYGNGGSNYMKGGIYISSCTTANTIRNNNVHNNLDGGILINYALTTICTGNTVTNNSGYGIMTNQCNGSTVTGNTITGNSPNTSYDGSTGTYLNS